MGLPRDLRDGLQGITGGKQLWDRDRPGNLFPITEKLLLSNRA